MDLERWIGAPPPPLARAVGARLGLFQDFYRPQADWPVLALPALMGELYRMPRARAAALAEACALFFLAADIVDDAQDGDLPPELPWEHAVNAGHALLFASIGAFARAAPGADVAGEIHGAGLRLVSGQARDLDFTWDSPPDEAAILDAVRGKAGSSLRLFARMGALAAGLSPPQVDIWGDIGDSFGMAAQLRTDLQDLASPESSDFRNRKATLPLVFALRDPASAFRAAARAGDWKEASRALEVSGALDRTETLIEELVVDTVRRIDRLDLDPWGQARVKDLVFAAISAFGSL